MLLFGIFNVSANTLSESPPSTNCSQQCQIDENLGPKLSENASIVHTTTEIPRWSDFDAPRPGSVVNVASEHDVLLTVHISLQILTVVYLLLVLISR